MFAKNRSDKKFNLLKHIIIFRLLGRFEKIYTKALEPGITPLDFKYIDKYEVT